MRWVAVTSGEQLFLMIREVVLPSLPSSPSTWNEVQEVLSSIGGSLRFDAYVRGAIAVQAMRRLIRHCSELIETASATSHIRLVSDFASEEVFPSLDRALLGRLARLVVPTIRVCGRAISNATRDEVLSEMDEVYCYLCGLRLEPAAPDGEDAFLGLDHIWPSSLGGDSTKENLLPACLVCQHRKADGPSWEWLNVHNLVWSSTPSQDTCSRLPRETRIARHLLHATEIAAENNWSLKQTLVNIGKMNFPSTFARGNLPATFFDMQTLEE
jgi:hypothetical protein